MRDLYQIYAQYIFAESRPYYQTARISRSDVTVLLCLNRHYAVNNVWRVELYDGWNFNSGNYLFTTDTK